MSELSSGPRFVVTGAPVYVSWTWAKASQEPSSSSEVSALRNAEPENRRI